MKKILLLSDTHSYIDDAILKHVKQADEIWHAGDVGTIGVLDELKKRKPLRAVYGNIDGNDVRIEYPKNLIFDCEEVKVYITHIGGYPGKYVAEPKAIIKQEKPKLFNCSSAKSHFTSGLSPSVNNAS